MNLRGTSGAWACVFVCFAALLAAPSSRAVGETGDASTKYDWDTWRRIVVQEGGRMKPLDTLAWEFIVGVAGRGSLHPEGFAPISIADVRDWPGLAKNLSEASSAADSPPPTPQRRVAEKLTPKLKQSLAKLDWDTVERAARLK